MANKPEGQLKIRDMLLPVIPKLIQTLLRLAKAKTQTEFVEGISADASEISRYLKRGVVPMSNLPALGERAGLSFGQTAWLLGSYLVEHYAADRLDADEIREQSESYDQASVERELDAVQAIDLTRLEPSRQMERTLERNQLHDHCKEALKGTRRELGMLVELLRGFRGRCEKELRRAKSDRYPPR